MRSGQGSVIIPAYRHRDKIIEEVATALGMTSGPRLYNLLRETYWWSGMRAACVKFSSTSSANQVERAKFLSPPYLFPTDKGKEPFGTWCIDTMVGF